MITHISGTIMNFTNNGPIMPFKVGNERFGNEFGIFYPKLTHQVVETMSSCVINYIYTIEPFIVLPFLMEGENGKSSRRMA